MVVWDCSEDWEPDLAGAQLVPEECVYEDGMALWVYRCPLCGSVGTRGSACEGHGGPLGAALELAGVERRPVLVPEVGGGLW